MPTGLPYFPTTDADQTIYGVTPAQSFKLTLNTSVCLRRRRGDRVMQINKAKPTMDAVLAQFTLYTRGINLGVGEFSYLEQSGQLTIENHEPVTGCLIPDLGFEGDPAIPVLYYQEPDPITGVFHATPVPILEASAGLRASFPLERNSLHAIANLSQAIEFYYTFIPDAFVVTDYKYVYPPGTFGSMPYATGLTLTANTLAAGVDIGTYLSAAYFQGSNPSSANDVPISRLPDATLLDSEKRDHTYMDYSQPVARGKMIAAIIAHLTTHIAAYPRNTVYMADDLAWIGATDIEPFVSPYSSDDYLTYLEELSVAVRGLGLLFCPNAHFHPEAAGIGDAFCRRISNLADYLLLEVPMTYHVNNADKVEHLVQNYSTILSSNRCVPCLIANLVFTTNPGGNQAAYDAEVDFLAHAGYIIGGGKIGTCYPFFMPPRPCFTALIANGPPTSPIFQSGTTLSRHFGTTLVMVDFANRSFATT